MEPAANKPFRKHFKKLPYGNSFVDQSDLGPELNESNCTPELWEILKHHDTPRSEESKSVQIEPSNLFDASTVYENMINDHLDTPIDNEPQA